MRHVPAKLGSVGSLDIQGLNWLTQSHLKAAPSASPIAPQLFPVDELLPPLRFYLLPPYLQLFLHYG